MLGKTKLIHCVGIGGAGISGIALVLNNLGFTVTGSDIKPSEITKELERQGIKVYYKHRPENIANCDVLVYSQAVPFNNPEIVKAKEQNIPIIHRAEMLSELCRMKTTVAVSGTHGKTTTTSLISQILETANLDPTTIIGGRILGKKSGGKLGKSEYFVTEADESDKSFLLIHPTIGVITNIEREHLDHYKNLKEIKNAFLEFANHTPFYGLVVLGIDSKGARELLHSKQIKRRVVAYGIENRQADLEASDIKPLGFGTEFTLKIHNREKGKFYLNLPGDHNIQNALAAIGTSLELGIDLNVIKEALEKFSGVHRRLERVGVKRGVAIFDDYGHHPTEVKVTLKTLRKLYPKNRIIAIFEPHRYTRTKFLYKDFALAFGACDFLVITDIYPASEQPIPGVSAQLIVDAIKNKRQKIKNPKPEIIEYLPLKSGIIDFLLPQLMPNDVIITLGAGNIYEIGNELLERI